MGRWDAELDAFTAADRVRMLPPGGIVFTGSSSIVRWSTLAEDFPGLPVLNRGFGGSTLAQVVDEVGRVVAPYRPRAVVLYAGSHDIHNGAAPITPAQAAGLVDRFAALVRAHAPGCVVHVLALKPSLAKWATIDRDREFNRLVAAMARPGELEFIDVWTPMLAGQAQPSPALFAPDRNHLSRDGYRLWASVLRPHLARYGDSPTASAGAVS